MRLIDADSLEAHEQIEPLGNGMYEYVQVVYKDDIEDAPTIEPAHGTGYRDGYKRGKRAGYKKGRNAGRKKGKWTSYNSCPFCGFQPWYERDIHALSYCPNCGADMREEGGE